MNKPKPLPEIERCPYPGCGKQSFIVRAEGQNANSITCCYWVGCLCGAHGARRKTARGAINAHNRVALAAKRGA